MTESALSHIPQIQVVSYTAVTSSMFGLEWCKLTRSLM